MVQAQDNNQNGCYETYFGSVQPPMRGGCVLEALHKKRHLALYVGLSILARALVSKLVRKSAQRLGNRGMFLIDPNNQRCCSGDHYDGRNGSGDYLEVSGSSVHPTCPSLTMRLT